MKTAGQASESWKRLKDTHSLQDLRALVHKSDPVTSGLRSVCWKVFLLFEVADQSKWPDILSDSRNTYDSFRSHFLRAIHHPDEFDTGVDPLSDAEESPWEALRKDEALRAEILQDVERCMPENMYFRESATQTMMVDILFIYCKLNPDVGYRQGMHEVLAPILWAVERDSLDIETFAVKDANFQHRFKLMPSVLDPKYIESDAFTLYGIIMQTAKSFYDPGPAVPSQGSSSDSPMLLRSKKIFNEILAEVDPQLHAHLVKLDIIPQIYLMRWVRLLFGREFPFEEVLSIWDLLFAEDPQLQLVDHICVAMLLRIRWQLVEADTNTAFTLLLRYPAPEEPARTFVEDALKLRERLTTDTAGDIILKRTKRAPDLVNEATSRSNTPLSRRPRSPLRSPSRFVPQPGSLEAMLQSAAKDVFNRSQKLGLNKAVRDAVGEVRKNMQGLQSSLSSPRSSSEYRTRALSIEAAANQPASELLERISALEDRNKQLAKMLQSSVAVLWECQADRADSAKDDESDKAALEALSGAIAKVQFVQIYLDDSSMPLPLAEADQDAVVTGASTSPPKESISEKAEPTAVAPSSLSGGSPAQAPLDLLPLTSSPPPPIPPQSPPMPAPVIVKSKPPPSRTRPSLASSTFSWMISQDTQPSRTFVSTTSPHSAFPSDTRRGHRANASLSGKGFLFGDDDDTSAQNTERSKSKNSKTKIETEPDEEVIDLGPLGSSVS